MSLNIGMQLKISSYILNLAKLTTKWLRNLFAFIILADEDNIK